MKNVTLILTALFLSACLQSNSPDQQPIHGTWTSIDDPNSSIVFEGDVMTDLYHGSIKSTGIFEVTKKTSEVTSAIKGPYLVVRKEEEIFKYAILELTKSDLTLMFLPRGNILYYTK